VLNAKRGESRSESPSHEMLQVHTQDNIVGQSNRRKPSAALTVIRKAARLAAWTYLIAIVSIWILLGTCGDRWWFATVLLYAPRWLYGIPLAALIPAAACANRRSLGPLMLGGLIFLVPIMGLRLPLRQIGAANGPSLRVLTCNVQGGAIAQNALMDLVRAEQADLVALQECSAEVQFEFPPEWQVLRKGQLLVASRFPLRDVQHSVRAHPHSPWPPVNALRCLVAHPVGDVGLCCVHLQTPRPGLEKVLDRQTAVNPARSWMLREETEYRLWESEELEAWIADFDGPTIIAGDFNMPVDSAIYRSTWSHWTNAFNTSGFGFGYTKNSAMRGWSYGSRIDHILFDSGFFRCRSCWIAQDVGSDHTPLVADLVLAKARDSF
jgi:endonuclease/exonuclease/phosphatase (EEP) superfamily protein YafD